MNKDQLLEAIRELKEMGFEVIPKERGRIPDPDKQEIENELQHYEKNVKDRLHSLDQQDREKTHELTSLEMVQLFVDSIRDDIRAGRLAEVFKTSIDFGRELYLLPDGLAPHRYDAQRAARYKQTDDARKGPAVKMEQNPFRMYGKWLRNKYPDASATWIIENKISKSPHPDYEPEEADSINDWIFYKCHERSEEQYQLFAKNDLTGGFKEISFNTFRGYLSKKN